MNVIIFRWETVGFNIIKDECQLVGGWAFEKILVLNYL